MRVETGATASQFGDEGRSTIDLRKGGEGGVNLWPQVSHDRGYEDDHCWQSVTPPSTSLPEGLPRSTMAVRQSSPRRRGRIEEGGAGDWAWPEREMAAWQPEQVPSTAAVLSRARRSSRRDTRCRSARPRRKSRRERVVGGEHHALANISVQSLYHGESLTVHLTAMV